METTSIVGTIIYKCNIILKAFSRLNWGKTPYISVKKLQRFKWLLVRRGKWQLMSFNHMACRAGSRQCLLKNRKLKFAKNTRDQLKGRMTNAWVPLERSSSFIDKGLSRSSKRKDVSEGIKSPLCIGPWRRETPVLASFTTKKRLWNSKIKELSWQNFWIEIKVLVIEWKCNKFLRTKEWS